MIPNLMTLQKELEALKKQMEPLKIKKQRRLKKTKPEIRLPFPKKKSEYRIIQDGTGEYFIERKSGFTEEFQRIYFMQDGITIRFSTLEHTQQTLRYLIKVDNEADKLERLSSFMTEERLRARIKIVTLVK